MSPTVDYSEVARLDIAELTVWYLANTDEDTAIRALSALVTEIDYLAETPMVGNLIAGLGRSFRYWEVLNRKYKAYYERLGPEYIKVLRVYGSRRRELTPAEILKSKDSPRA